MLTFLTLLGIWAAAGAAALWWGARAPAPGSRRLVRTCDRWVAHVHSEVTVRLWPNVADLPALDGEIAPCRVVLVVDHSSSMGTGPGSPLARSIEAAISFVRATVSSTCRVAAVEFDGDARIVHPMSDSAQAVAEALRGIGPGGATDIAMGLRYAQQALVDSDAAVERVVIILSDGGSNETAAERQAASLKGDGVRIIAIGLGSRVNEGLMQRIASGPQDYYHTLDAGELTRLYDTVRRTLTSPRGFRARVEESVGPGLVLAAAGDVAPYDIRFSEGTVRWFLPFLAPVARDIPYQVLPVRAGWHPVGRGPATIELFDRDGLPHRGQSNSSPRLLVLPAWCPGWLAWFFNPLFWLAWSALFRRRAASYVLSPDSPQTEIRLPEAEPVQVPLTRETRSTLAPTLIVGVGYAGSAVLRALRLHLTSLTPVPHGSIQSLWVDTGTSSDDDLRYAPAFGEAIADVDRVLMPENVYDLFERTRRSTPPPARLSWLDANAARQGLGPDDYRLTGGTRRRRILARAALTQHLERGGDAALSAAIDQRLTALGQHARVILVGHTSGGTGGGMLLDLALWIRKRALAIDIDLRSLDLLLLTHRALGQAGSDDVYARNAIAFASELSRRIVRPQPLRLSQTPAEDEQPTPVADFVDRVLVAEQPLESASTPEVWPYTAAHNAAEILLHLLVRPDEGAMRKLDGVGDQIRAQIRRSGQAIVHAAGTTARWLPVEQIRRFLSASAAREFLTRDFLLLERRDGALVLAKREELQQIGRDLVAGLLSGASTSRPMPALLDSLAALADTGTSGRELTTLLPRLEFYPGTTEIPLWIASGQLTAEVLQANEDRMTALLQEWVLGILNGRPQSEQAFDPDVRRAALSRARSAAESLHAAIESAVKNLTAMRDSVRAPTLINRFEFVLLAFQRYRVVASFTARQLGEWEATLIAAAERADAAVAEAHRALAALASVLQPFALWNANIEEALVAEYVAPVRRDLLKQSYWASIAGAAGTSRISLRIRAGLAPAPDFHSGPASAPLIAGTLEQLAIDARVHGIARESVHRWIGVERWFGFERLNPVAFESGDSELQDYSERYECAMVPAEPPLTGTVVELLPTEFPYRASLIRMIVGCPVSSIAAFRDYERRAGDERRSALPFLDPVDRVAAHHEDRFASLGIASGGLCPAIRAYFQDRDLLRAFSLAFVLDMVSMKPAARSDELFLGSLQLSDRATGGSHPTLTQSLDNYVVRGRAADGSTFDRAAQIAAVEQALRQIDRPALNQLAERVNASAASWLNSSPPIIRADFLRVVRLFVEIEIERRTLAVGEGAV